MKEVYENLHQAETGLWKPKNTVERKRKCVQCGHSTRNRVCWACKDKERLKWASQ